MSLRGHIQCVIGVEKMSVETDESKRKHWLRVKELCLQALQLEGGDRAEFLSRACGSDERLRSEVSELVEHEASESCLDGPPICSMSRLVAEEEAGLPAGKQIGDYRIVRRIASGGMSDVYLANRSGTPADETAAIKVLRHASASTHSIKRFRREQKIQASLRHPRIARFKDAGITDNGQYFLIMEYVQGVPITTYCRRQRLCLNERLQLFNKVCEAVCYAHGMLIIHRDLKPTNILVTPDGEPTLLDFGGVKILKAAEGIDVFETVDHGQFPFTLAYASPELIRNEPVSTRSDVFTLGVILYELITEIHPFSTKAASPFDLAKAICEEDPMPLRAAMRAARRQPSDRAEYSGDNAGTPASAKTTTEVNPRIADVPADLATMIEMALQKDPDRRYTSAERLSDDIQSYLGGRPVRACKDSLGYRAAKFARRNKRAVLAVAALFLSLIAGVVGTSLGLMTARRERDSAIQARARSASVLQFLESVLVPGNRYADNSDTTLQEVMDYADTRLDTWADPQTEAAIRHVLGRIRMRFGDYEGARRHLTKAQSTRVQTLGLEHPDSIESTLELIDILIASGKLGEATEWLEQLRALPATRSRPCPSDTADIWLLDGKANATRKNFVRARRSFEHALALLRSDAGHDASQLGDALYHLARLHRDLKEYDKANDYLVEATEVNRRGGDDHYLRAIYLNERALMYQSQGRFDEAEPLYRESIEAHIRSVGPDHIEVAKVRFNLATLLEDRGQFAKAEGFYRDSLDTALRVLGERHANVVTMRCRLAYLLFKQNRLDQAKAMFHHALEMASEHFGERSWEAARVMIGYAVFLKDCDEFEAATQLHQRILEITRSKFGSGHIQVGLRLNSAAQVLIDAGDYAGAESMLREASQILEVGVTGNNPRVLAVRSHLGRLFHLQGRNEEAETLLRDVLRQASKEESKSMQLVAQAEIRLAEVLCVTDRAEEAAPIARRGLTTQSDLSPAPSVRIAYAQTVLGECLTALGRYEEARDLLTRGYAQLHETGRLNGGRTIRALERLIHFHEARGEESDADRLTTDLRELVSLRTDRQGRAKSTDKLAKRRD